MVPAPQQFQPFWICDLTHSQTLRPTHTRTRSYCIFSALSLGLGSLFLFSFLLLPHSDFLLVSWLLFCPSSNLLLSIAPVCLAGWLLNCLFRDMNPLSFSRAAAKWFGSLLLLLLLLMHAISALLLLFSLFSNRAEAKRVYSPVHTPSQPGPLLDCHLSRLGLSLS